MGETVEGEQRVASTELLTFTLGIDIDRQEVRHSMRLADVMRLKGWERTSNKMTIKGKQVRGYFRLAPNAK
jgi:hypothetical protein